MAGAVSHVRVQPSADVVTSPHSAVEIGFEQPVMGAGVEPSMAQSESHSCVVQPVTAGVVGSARNAPVSSRPAVRASAPLLGTLVIRKYPRSNSAGIAHAAVAAT